MKLAFRRKNWIDILIIHVHSWSLVLSHFVSFHLVDFFGSLRIWWLAGTVRISAFAVLSSRFHCLKVVPLGHFLATFHKQGVALWAGTEFAKKAKNLTVNFNKKRPMILWFHSFLQNLPFIGCYGQMDVLLAQIRFAHDVGIQVVWHDVAVFEMKCQLLSNIFTYGTLRASNIWNFRQQRTAVVNVIHGIRVIQHQHLSHRNELQPGKCFDLEQHRCIGKWPSSGPLPSESNRVICSHVFALSSCLKILHIKH